MNEYKVEIYITLNLNPPRRPASVTRLYEEKRMPRGAKNYCFTTNNPAGDDSTYVVLSSKVRYAVWQRETAPTTGTVHLQGYIQFTTVLSMTAACRHLPGASLRVAVGTPEQNKTYCTKDSDRVSGTHSYEIGEAMVKGQRNDLLKLKKKIDDGATELELFEYDFPTMIRYKNALLYYKQLIQPKRNWITKVIVLSGPTGCGKSHYVNEHACTSTEDGFRQCNDHWFGFYAGEQHVIFDEFYGSRFKYSYLLQLLDRYAMRVQNKGGEVNFAPRWIWITSNANAHEWYDKPWAPLERRLSINFVIGDFEPRDVWRARLDVLIEELEDSEI